MVYVWPLSPSSYDVGVVGVVVTNWIDGQTSHAIAYFVDSVWVDTFCYSCSIGTYSLDCGTIYSPMGSSIVFQPFISTSAFD
jgi:hypothetical protein